MLLLSNVRSLAPETFAPTHRGAFGLSATELFEEFSERPRLNISISQRVPIVTLDEGQRKLSVAEWGFLAP
jgi:hypothetical protein